MPLGACGSWRGPTAGTSSAPAADSPPAALASAHVHDRRTLGVQSRAATTRRTVSVGVGWAVDVDLRAPESGWRVPTEVGVRLLRQVADAARDAARCRSPHEQPALPGRTELRSLQRPLCHPGACARSSSSCGRFALTSSGRSNGRLPLRAATWRRSRDRAAAATTSSSRRWNSASSCQLLLQAPAHARGGDRQHLAAQVARAALVELARGEDVRAVLVPGCATSSSIPSPRSPRS